MTTTSSAGPISVRIKDPMIETVEQPPVAPPVPPTIESPKIVAPTPPPLPPPLAAVVEQPPEVKMEQPVVTVAPAVLVEGLNQVPAPPPVIKRTTTVTQVKPLAAAPVSKPLLIAPESKGVQIFQWILIVLSIVMVLSAGAITYSKVHQQNQIARPHTVPTDEPEQPVVAEPSTKKIEENEIADQIDKQPAKPIVREKKPVRIAPVVAQSVIGSKKYYTSYLMTDLSVEKRTGGSRSWRLNNPGRIVANQFTKAYGAIGTDNGLAIFPSYAHGQRALIAMLFERPEMQYNHLPLQSAMQKFVPSKYADEYSAELVKLVPGIKPSTIMSSMGADTRKEVAKAIEQLEIFQLGRTEKYTTEQVYKEKG